MLKVYLGLFLAIGLVACSSGAEDTHVFIQERNSQSAVIGIHISLLNHPPETHYMGYDRMQNLAEASCQEFGKTAKYTGKQERKTLGTSYDTWLERTYRCV